MDLPFRGELYRKALHLMALSLPAAVIVFGKPDALYLLIPLSVTAWTLDILRARVESVNRLIDRWFGSMMRSRERTRVGERIVINGATWVVSSITLLTILFPLDVAVIAFCVFMIGDAAAALAGRKFGRHHWGRVNCTLEGSLAFLLAGTVTALLLAGSPMVSFSLYSIPWQALLGAVVVATMLEAMPIPINDNIAAPLGAALLLVALAG